MNASVLPTGLHFPLTNLPDDEAHLADEWGRFWWWGATAKNVRRWALAAGFEEVAPNRARTPAKFTAIAFRSTDGEPILHEFYFPAEDATGSLTHGVVGRNLLVPIAESPLLNSALHNYFYALLERPGNTPGDYMRDFDRCAIIGCEIDERTGREGALTVQVCITFSDEQLADLGLNE